MLFRGGFPRYDDEVGLSERQYAIFHLQKALAGLAKVLSPTAEIHLFDRGLLDGICYWPGSSDDFAKKMNIDIKDTLEDYDIVIQLGVADKSDYENSAFRPENQETSLNMEQKLKEIWGSHPNYCFIPYTLEWDKKVQACLELINRNVQN